MTKAQENLIDRYTAAFCSSVLDGEEKKEDQLFPRIQAEFSAPVIKKIMKLAELRAAFSTAKPGAASERAYKAFDRAFKRLVETH
jgi:hypothetical protein